jgi:hypothetical protein
VRFIFSLSLSASGKFRVFAGRPVSMQTRYFSALVFILIRNITLLNDIEKNQFIEYISVLFISGLMSPLSLFFLGGQAFTN